MFGKATYFILMAFFAGTAAIIIWSLHFRFLIKYKRLFVKLALFLFPFTIVAENVAAKLLHCWGYREDKILGLWFLGIPIETWIYAYLVFLLVLTPAFLLFCEFEKQGVTFWQMFLRILKKESW